VSAPYAWKISSQRRRSGQMERVEQRHGPRSRMGPDVQARLRVLLRQQPDWTLTELHERLLESAGVAVSVQHLWRVLQKMGLRLKKSRSTRRSKTRSKFKPAARGGGKR
jgi:transposase